MSPLQYSILTHIHTRGCLFVCFLVRPTGLETHRQIIFFNIAPNLTGGVAVNPEGACSFVPFVARPRFLAPPPPPTRHGRTIRVFFIMYLIFLLAYYVLGLGFVLGLLFGRFILPLYLHLLFFGLGFASCWVRCLSFYS